jgi:hypothetical protein
MDQFVNTIVCYLTSYLASCIDSLTFHSNLSSNNPVQASHSPPMTLRLIALRSKIRSTYNKQIHRSNQTIYVLNANHIPTWYILSQKTHRPNVQQRRRYKKPRSTLFQPNTPCLDSQTPPKKQYHKTPKRSRLKPESNPINQVAYIYTKEKKKDLRPLFRAPTRSRPRTKRAAQKPRKLRRLKPLTRAPASHITRDTTPPTQPRSLALQASPTRIHSRTHLKRIGRATRPSRRVLVFLLMQGFAGEQDGAVKRVG